MTNAGSGRREDLSVVRVACLLIESPPRRLNRGFLESHGFEAVHWSEVGDPKADDTEILDWARERGRVVFTNDLDFSRLLALTRGKGPSVIQARTEDLLPDAIGALMLQELQQHREPLLEGALVVIELDTLRVRLLPL